jgi:hypothetical protein
MLNIGREIISIAPLVHFQIARHCAISCLLYVELLREVPEYLASCLNERLKATASHYSRPVRLYLIHLRNVSH